MRKYALLGLVFALGSCIIDYEDNKRVIVDIETTDASNDPISDIAVDVFASTGSGPYNIVNLIGSGKTDAAGRIRVVAISPKTNSFLEVLVNDQFQQGFKPNYVSYRIQRLDILGESNNTYFIPKLLLEQLNDATLILNRTTNLTDTLSYQILFKNNHKILDFSNLRNEFPNDPNVLAISGRILPDQITESQELFQIIENDTLLLKYTLFNKNSVEVGESQLMFNEESKTYEFDY